MTDSATPGLVARIADPSFVASVSFRAAMFDDVVSLVPMINDAYVRESHIIPGPRTNDIALRVQIATTHTRLRLAEVNGGIAGCVRVRLLDDGAWFGLLATHLRHQGRGLASLLVAEAERVAHQEGHTTMRLDCAAELGLPPYYASLGYEIESTEQNQYFTSDGPPPRRKGPITRVVMRKDLR
jgi:GNAT superfamily N-acetyltransferase